MKYLRILFACFLLLFLQIALVPKISIGEISPDFPLLLTAYLAMNRGTLQGSLAGFVVGLVQDLFNPHLLGLNALAKSATGYGVGVAASKAETNNALFLVLLFGVAALAHDGIYLLFFTGLNIVRCFVLWFTVSVPSAAYTAIVGMAVYKTAMYFEAKVVRAFGKARP